MSEQKSNDHTNLVRAWIDYLKQPIEGRLPKPKDELLNSSEVQKVMSISEPTFYRKCKSGELTHTKPAGIRVWISDVARHLLAKESY